MQQVPKQSFASSIKNGGLPNITGGFTVVSSSHTSNASGVFSFVNYENKQHTANGGNFWSEGLISFDASRVSSVYDSGTTVRPAAVYTNWCIKF